MASFQHLCMCCMQPMDPDSRCCPHCGYDNDQPQRAPYLPKGAVLSGRYLVGKMIALSPDGAIYAGQDLQTMQTVQIREYLPEKLIDRQEGTCEVRVRLQTEQLYQSGMGAFSSLWQTLQKNATHPSLPQVYAVLFLNGTVYAVCAALECISLREYMRQPEHVLSWNDCRAAFKPLFRALSALHAQGVEHLAISPTTVFVGADGKLHLDGFSIPQCKSALAAFRTPPDPCYAPVEVQNGDRPGAWSDVYSILAVLYLCLTGKEPPTVADRAVADELTLPVELARTLPPQAIDTLYAGMQLYPQRRLHSIEELMVRLYPNDYAPQPALQDEETADEPEIELLPDEDPSLPDAQPASKKETSAGLLGLEAFLAILVIGTMLFCTLYSTVLYTKMEIPLLDSILAPLTFLPLNSEEETTTTRPTAVTEENEPSKEQVTVPNLLSMSYSDLTSNLALSRNFDLQIEFEASETLRKNAIISQSLTAGQQVAKGTTLVVTVSTGKPTVELRDVIGLNYMDAYDMLTEDGFDVKKVLLENDGSHEVGTVYTMSLVAGLSFEKGTSVTLSVWDATGFSQQTSDEETP